MEIETFYIALAAAICWDILKSIIKKFKEL
jgi:hypothetical protein